MEMLRLVFNNRLDDACKIVSSSCKPPAPSPLPAVSPGHVNFLFLQVLPILLSFIIFPYRILIVPSSPPPLPPFYTVAQRNVSLTRYMYFYITGREREKYIFYTYVCKFILREARTFYRLHISPPCPSLFHSSLSPFYLFSPSVLAVLSSHSSRSLSPFFPARI